MEKRTPQTKLAIVRTLIASKQVRYTASALVSAAHMGFDRVGILDVVMALDSADFTKV
jgi:motility quorum-sensing regulator / GCU-specific mRNA interferase toxin